LATALLQIFDWAWQGYLRKTAIIPVKLLGYCHSLFIACHYGLMNRYTERYVDLGRQVRDYGGIPRPAWSVRESGAAGRNIVIFLMPYIFAINLKPGGVDNEKIVWLHCIKGEIPG